MEALDYYFVSNHCAILADIEGEHDHGQYQIFQEFRTMVDGMVDGVLSDVGSTAEEFIGSRRRNCNSQTKDPAMQRLKLYLPTFDV